MDPSTQTWVSSKLASPLHHLSNLNLCTRCFAIFLLPSFSSASCLTDIPPPLLGSPYNMPPRKRKVDDDGDEMSVSPSGSPSIAQRHLARPSKKVRGANDLSGRPLSLPRLLETLDTTQLTGRPSDHLRAPSGYWPRGCDRRSETNRCWGYGRSEGLSGQVAGGGSVRPVEFGIHILPSQAAACRSHRSHLRLHPQFLPPTEQQTNVSLQYLDHATKVIHQLPDWDGQQYRHHKDNAYDEIASAWALVITEASKRGGGFILHSGGWDQVLAKHNQQSGGRLEPAINAMAMNVSWMGSNSGSASGSEQLGLDP